MKKWEVNHEGNTIVVENKGIGEKLLINGELQDELMGLAFRSRLWGQLPGGENVKVSLGGSWFTLHCRIFINNKLVFSE